jgi:hypothetical protein
MDVKKLNADRTGGPQRLLTSYALTLFILGVMIALLAILGRIAQEYQHRVLGGVSMLPRGLSGSPSARLPPLIASLDRSGSGLVLAGFVVGAICMACGGALWFRSGRPDAPYARFWTALGSGIAACLVISMTSAAFVAYADLRLAALIIPGALALLLFMTLVYLIAERTLLGP